MCVQFASNNANSVTLKTRRLHLQKKIQLLIYFKNILHILHVAYCICKGFNSWFIWRFITIIQSARKKRQQKIIKAIIAFLLLNAIRLALQLANNILKEGTSAANKIIALQPLIRSSSLSPFPLIKSIQRKPIRRKSYLRIKTIYMLFEPS